MAAAAAPHHASAASSATTITHSDELYAREIQVFINSLLAIPGLIANYDEMTKRLAGWLLMLDQYRKDVEEGANRLVKTYRHANIAARSSAAPHHFNVPVALDPSCASLDATLLQSNARFNVGDLSDYQDKIVAAYEEIVSSLPTLENR